MRPLASGAAGRDGADPELGERPPELGRGAAVGQLLLQGEDGRGRGLEDAVPVAVPGAREAVAADGVAQDDEIPRRVLLVAERGPDQDARGIVDPAHERQPGPAALEPVVAAAVDLDEQPGRGIGRAGSGAGATGGAAGSGSPRPAGSGAR